MKLFLFSFFMFFACALSAQSIRFKVLKYDSKMGSQDWSTVYKTGGEGSITGIIDTTYKNISLSYNISLVDGQDIFKIQETWTDDLFIAIDVTCILMSVTAIMKDSSELESKAMFYRKDKTAYLIISTFDILQRYYRYELQIIN